MAQVGNADTDQGEMEYDEAYPIRKVGRGWIVDEMRGIKGPPTVYKTKRAAMAQFEAYLDVLRDKLAGRGDWS